MPSICYRFLHKQCPLSDAMCPLSHDKDDAPLCMYWKKGPCPSGNWCVNRHYYLVKDSWAKVAKANTHQGSASAQDDMEFNSPLVVKVKNVVETHRREEVDLETGRRRSWIETENKELIDITGEDSPVPAPVKKVNVKKDKVVKKKINLEEGVKETKGKSKEEMLSKKLSETGITMTVVEKPTLKEKRKQVDDKSTGKENTKTVDDKSSDKNRNKSTTSRKVEKRKVTTALEKTNESNENSVAEKEKENEKPKTGAQNCSVCGRSFKGDKGLQMHLARSSCGKQTVN